MATSLHPTRAASGSAVLTVGRTEIDITSNDDQILNGVQSKSKKIALLNAVQAHSSNQDLNGSSDEPLPFYKRESR
jgi:hypothetical protein